MNCLSYILTICLIIFGVVLGNQITVRGQKDVEIDDLRAEKEISDSLHLYKDERLKNYLMVTGRQDIIIENHYYTVEEKKNDSTLLYHSSKL